MPYKSKAQSRYLHAMKPGVAEEFDKKTKTTKGLPERVKKTKKKKKKAK